VSRRIVALVAALAGLLAVASCHRSHRVDVASTGGAGGAPSMGAGGAGGWASYHFPGLDGGTADAAPANPCMSACGPTELCDPAHLGFDDNCNGLVDETCTCSPGAVHWCFAGDPSYRGVPGCFDGVETCSELGVWGPCIGGVQAIAPDTCFLNDTSACHAITALPYATTDLKTGTGSFGQNAIPGSETYTVTCPSGVPQCPGVMPPESFTALQSGEYTVTYTKQVAGLGTGGVGGASGDAGSLSCTFPLFVGAPGLRVELSWEHHLPGPTKPYDYGVDLDLSVHQPGNSSPWSTTGGQPQDCGYANCKFSTLSGQTTGPGASPHWFVDSNVPPQPVNWYLNPVAAANTCYGDVQGVGAEWAALGMGCHSPRLDIDEITCDDTITDPNDPDFCAPENINIDYPPMDEWVRIGVHYFWNHSQSYDVHPEIKVFCNGALAADLGPSGYSMPASAVTFPASDGAASGGIGNIFWIAADVAFTTDSCGRTSCVVQPLYADASNTPILILDTDATASFVPAWPAPPGADAGL
jgi:hypothetical protein